MPGRVEGKVAFITGAARGQGRSHAVRLAQEGADIIAVDICRAGPVGRRTRWPPRRTWPRRCSQVEALDRRIIARKADVRDAAGAAGAPSTTGVAELGRLDIVCANAGHLHLQPALELDRGRPGRR